MRSEHKPSILMTGRPGSGKTTIVKEIISLLKDESGGFYTREIRSKGVRVGFEIVTLDGEMKILAQKSTITNAQNVILFGNYWVDLDAVNSVAVPSLVKAMNENKVIVIDEIGPMEILSTDFCEVVLNILNTVNIPVVGTIVERPYVFADAVKSHPRVEIVTITSDTRDSLALQVYRRLVVSKL